jgi:epsilon-lactone hydrolase
MTTMVQANPGAPALQRALGTAALLRTIEAAPAFALAEALRWTWRPAVDVVGGRAGQIRAVRATTEAYARLLPGTRGVAVRSVSIDCADRRLSAEWAVPRDANPGAILYLHGGGFVFGSARTHRVLTGRLAADSRLPVLTPTYRLAPEHPFPAAFDDALAAYQHLLGLGIAPESIVLAGDSSGSHLAAGLVAGLGPRGLPLPAGVILFSPWLDLGCTGARLADHRRRDPFVSPAAAERLARLYLGEGADPADARLRPAPSALGPLPPFLIQVGGREALQQDAYRFAEDLARSGTECRFETWPGQIHVFQLLNRWLPAARSAMQQAADFAAACVTGCSE